MTTHDIDLLGDVEATHAEVVNDQIVVTLSDGRHISAPLNWYARLREATPEQLANIEVLGDAIWWPDLDESLDVEGMLRGINPLIMA